MLEARSIRRAIVVQRRLEKDVIEPDAKSREVNAQSPGTRGNQQLRHQVAGTGPSDTRPGAMRHRRLLKAQVSE